MAVVLIVEDQEAVCALMERVLTTAGHHVSIAYRRSEADALCRTMMFDVAIVDQGLPDGRGTVVLETLRASQPNCVRILTSGALDVDAAVDAVNRAQITRVLPKPFEASALVVAVAEALAAHEARGRLFESTDDRRDASMLLECLDADVLRIAIQPMVDARTGAVHAYEALMRSSHPVLRGPLDVLGAAERRGRIDDLADFLATLNARALAAIPAEARLFINLHPAELAVAARLTSRLQAYQGASERVVFELTEHASLHGIPEAERSIGIIRASGFRVAVDDLGAGSSTLSLLAELQPDFMKVDMSLVRDVDKHARKARLVELLCKFGSATQTTVIVEGVETEAEAALLRALGADWMQGYFFGRPSLLGG